MVAIDYLIFNLRIKNKQLLFQKESKGLNEFFSLRDTEKGTQIFSKRYELYIKNRKAGILTFDPYKGSVLDDDKAQLQFENWLLYEPLRWLNVTTFDLFKAFGFEYEGLNRLDLAIDSNFKENSLFTEDLTNVGDWIRFGKIKGKEIVFAGKKKNFTEHKTTKNECLGWTFGQRSSDKYIRFYNKTLEMDLKGWKPHISNYWENFVELDISSPVWRFEIQLNRRFLKSMDETDLTNIFDRLFLTNLMEIAIEGFLDIRYLDGKKRVNLLKKVSLINFKEVSNFCKKFSYSTEKFSKKTRPKTCEFNSVLNNKKVLKSMMYEYVFSDQENIMPLALVVNILDLKNGFDYDTYLEDKLSFWLKDFQERTTVFNDFDKIKMYQDLKFIRNIDN